MAKIEFEEKPLNGVIINSVNNSLDHITQAINQFYSMNIPWDFCERNGLNQCRQETINIKRDLNELKEWIGMSTRTYKLTMDEMYKAASLLPRTGINVKNPVIK